MQALLLFSLHGFPKGKNLVLLLFLLRKNNNKHACAQRMIVTLHYIFLFKRSFCKKAALMGRIPCAAPLFVSFHEGFFKGHNP